MIDLKRLRDDPEYRRGIERKRVRADLVEEVLALDTVRRSLLGEVEGMRARQNAASNEIKQASPSERPAKIQTAGELKLELAAQESAVREVEESLRDRALQLPNPADASVPDGGEDDGEVTKVVGGTPDAPPLDHAAFGEALGLVDTAHAAEASGSRFAYVMREAVLLELALVNYAMDTIMRYDFAPVVTPTLVRERTMEEAGFFPTDRNQVYEVDGGELFLLGTSEVALSALHRGETLTPDQLPARYGGLSTCFRREAGTYGKDTRGIFRVHQFDKVEMFAFVEPDASEAEHERILAIEEELIGGSGPAVPRREHRGGRPRTGGGQEVRPRSVAPVGRSLPRSHVVLELHRLLGPPPRHTREGREGLPVGAHVERHGVRGEPHAGVPVRALPGARRRLRRCRKRCGATRASTASRPGSVVPGGMPERPNGAVLKTVVRKHPGFESLSLRAPFDTFRRSHENVQHAASEVAAHCVERRAGGFVVDAEPRARGLAGRRTRRLLCRPLRLPLRSFSRPATSPGRRSPCARVRSLR